MRNVIFLLIGKKRNHVTSYIEASAQVKYLGVILIAFLPSLPSPPSISESYWLYLQTHLNLVTSCHLHSYQYPHLLDFYSFLIDLLVSVVFQQSSPHCGRVVLQKCSLNDITPFFKTSLQLPIILKEKSQLLASAGPLPSYLALSSSPVPSLPTHFTPDTPVFWNTRNFSPRQILALSFPSVRVALPLDLQMAPPSNPSGFPVQMSTPQRGHALPSNILPSHNSLLYLHCPYQSLKLLLTIALFDHLSLSRDYKHHETETAPVLVATVTTVHSTVPGTWKVCLIILVDSTELKLE